MFGDGKQTRSFCFVKDLVEGIWRLLNSETNDPVNVGNPREMTILQFAEAILEATGSRSQISFKPLPVDDPKIRQPDITQAKAILGWQPQVPLEDGLRQTVAYFRQILDIPEQGS